MKHVAKILITDKDGYSLLLQRSDHPHFPSDPDLPGGTLEEGESPVLAMIREVEEEAGITLDGRTISKLYQGTEYSEHGTKYHLFTAPVDERPSVTISWEHESYGWVDHDTLMLRAGTAKDTYMRMVHGVLGK